MVLIESKDLRSRHAVFQDDDDEPTSKVILWDFSAESLTSTPKYFHWNLNDQKWNWFKDVVALFGMTRKEFQVEDISTNSEVLHRKTWTLKSI